ncbi:hypothetical protein KJA13_00540 [Patescibacteria group bacterium]|nr:hypothetical protein [Patescibacteria group bacterium]
MDSKILNKGFLFLVLLLVIVVGVFFWQNPEVTFDRIKAMIGPKISLFEDSGLDLSEINIENLVEKGPAFAPDGASAGKEEEGLVEEVQEGQGGPIIIFEPKLAGIQKEINEIAKEVERIDQEVKKLMALTEIQEGIDEITEKVAELSQELDKLT